MIDYLKRHHLLATVVAAAVIVVIALLAIPNVSTASAATLSLVGLAMSIMRFAVAIAALFVVLRVLDAAVSFDWWRLSGAIENSSVAVAVYFGLRFVAVAWIASACFS